MTRALAVGMASLATLCMAAPSFAQVKPVASAPTNWKDVTLDLMSVERKGSILTVKWAVRNASDKPAKVQFAMTGRGQTTYLLDEESGTKYYALTDKEKNTLASEHTYIGADAFGIQGSLAAGGTSRYWAKFHAPPAAVKSINIFFTNSDPFEGVAITDK